MVDDVVAVEEVLERGAEFVDRAGEDLGGRLGERDHRAGQGGHLESVAPIGERGKLRSLSQGERGTALAVERVAKVVRYNMQDCNGEGKR